ncbi:hypothetical protein DPEC_G00173560 [Dallia pectoralis]|uniref:Uncharacterized protein n=1 Tax=Dallia pectoralis TaxID=75939 RepID=A0ACC2GE78_DALPE|nr:hypothetical protein DPEC_G00173560 [Dallia pectoralis]
MHRCICFCEKLFLMGSLVCEVQNSFPLCSVVCNRSPVKRTCRAWVISETAMGCLSVEHVRLSCAHVLEVVLVIILVQMFCFGSLVCPVLPLPCT